MNMFSPAVAIALPLRVSVSVRDRLRHRPQRDVTIQESARGGVYLERIPTRQFQASHTRSGPGTHCQDLQGVQIREGKGLLQSFQRPAKPGDRPSSPRRISPFSLLPLRMD